MRIGELLKCYKTTLGVLSIYKVNFLNLDLGGRVVLFNLKETDGCKKILASMEKLVVALVKWKVRNFHNPNACD